MNDIQYASAYFNFILYADDTSLIQPLFKFNMETNFDDLNTELSKIYEWLCINKLSLNINKTKFIVFHTKRNKLHANIPVLKINEIIERAIQFNFLGITMNENLTWHDHINKISKRISRSIGVINKLKHCLPAYVLKILYFSLVQCHMTNGILAWGFNTTNILNYKTRQLESSLKVNILLIRIYYLRI